MSKVLELIKNHPMVESISDERYLGDGFWVYLKTGWIAASMECGSIHEDSPSKCYRVLIKKGNIVPDPGTYDGAPRSQS